MRDLACSNCVVSTLIGPAARENPEVTEATVEAIELLSSRGILRPIRYQRVVHG